MRCWQIALRLTPLPVWRERSNLRAQQSGQTVTASCAIGDADVTFVYHDGKTDTQSFSEIVEQARLYILTIGGFEKFAMWGLIRANLGDNS